MSPLRHALDDYLALRHAMGCKLRDAHPLLSPCSAFLDQPRATVITTDWAVRWATQPCHGPPAAWARRRRLVRGFAQYDRAIDPRTELPPPPQRPYRPQRHAPYLYGDAEIAPLIAAARPLSSATGLRAGTYATVFGLLAVTGMRMSALVARDRTDVDLRDGLRTMRDTKFRQSRCVPLHGTPQQALGRYVARRNRVHPRPHRPSFFVSAQGTRWPSCPVRATVVQLSRQIGLRGPRDSHGPR